MNNDKLLETLHEIIIQHNSFNRFNRIDNKEAFLGKRNREVKFKYKSEEDKIDGIFKVKQSCYIKDDIPYLKTKLYQWNGKKWEITKRNIRFIEGIYEAADSLDDVVFEEFDDSKKKEENKQMSLFDFM